MEVTESVMGGDGSPEYWDNSMVVVKAEMGESIALAENYFRNKPQGYRMGLFHIGESLLHHPPHQHPIRAAPHGSSLMRGDDGCR